MHICVIIVPFEDTSSVIPVKYPVFILLEDTHYAIHKILMKTTSFSQNNVSP